MNIHLFITNCLLNEQMKSLRNFFCEHESALEIMIQKLINILNFSITKVC